MCAYKHACMSVHASVCVRERESKRDLKGRGGGST